MDTYISTLGKNIKFLRKQHGFSQEKLAEKVGIKRSNIAAYEIKSVQPRLDVLIKLAQELNINTNDLIQLELDDSKNYRAYGQGLESIKDFKPLNNTSVEDLANLHDTSLNVRQMLEGFKAFYNMKKERISASRHKESEKLKADIENFIQLTDYLMAYNDRVSELTENISEKKSK